jgi:hypothetical protein
MHRFNFLLQYVLIVVLAINLQSCASVQQMIRGTPTFTPTITLTSTQTATITPTPTKTPSPTITPNITATKLYGDFFSLVEKYHDAGQIPSTEGKYLHLSDYQDQATGFLSYQWKVTGIHAKNFIIQADFDWSINVKTSTFSGCAFIFRRQSDGDHYLMVLDSLQGIRLAKNTSGTAYSMGPPGHGDKKDYNFGESPYHATFTLIVNELKAYVYVDNIYYGEYRLMGDRMTDSGALDVGVLSATDKGWTSCAMENIQIWTIDP